MPPQNGRKVAAAVRQVKSAVRRGDFRLPDERSLNGYSSRKYQLKAKPTSRNSIGNCVPSD
jgi:hypothetical protein